MVISRPVDDGSFRLTDYEAKLGKFREILSNFAPNLEKVLTDFKKQKNVDIYS